jgi:hypothetical protein
MEKKFVHQGVYRRNQQQREEYVNQKFLHKQNRKGCVQAAVPFRLTYGTQYLAVVHSWFWLRLEVLPRNKGYPDVFWILVNGIKVNSIPGCGKTLSLN